MFRSFTANCYCLPVLILISTKVFFFFFYMICFFFFVFRSRWISNFAAQNRSHWGFGVFGLKVIQTCVVFTCFCLFLLLSKSQIIVYLFLNIFEFKYRGVCVCEPREAILFSLSGSSIFLCQGLLLTLKHFFSSPVSF